VSWTVVVYGTAGNDGTVRTWIEEVGEATQVAWMWELWQAKLKFDVIYYNAGGTDMPKRQITMTDYIRAMYTVDEYGTPKATLPIFTGAPSNYRQYNIPGSGDIANPSSPQYWAFTDGDSPLYMTLFYYSDLIMPAVVVSTTQGSEDYRLKPDGVPTSSVKGRGKVRTDWAVLNGNGAQIPLATDDVHKVAQFSGFRGDNRLDSTDHGGEPTILGTKLNANNAANTALAGYPSDGFPMNSARPSGYDPNWAIRKDLYDQLKKYWKPMWQYDSEDPDWPDVIEEPVTRWYNFDGANGGPTGKGPTETRNNGRGSTKFDGVGGWTGNLLAGKYQYIGLADYDLDEIEENETRSCEVRLPAPPSVGPSEDDEWEYEYLVKP
jgi:hypothetical protein